MEGLPFLRSARQRRKAQPASASAVRASTFTARQLKLCEIYYRLLRQDNELLTEPSYIPCEPILVPLLSLFLLVELHKSLMLSGIL